MNFKLPNWLVYNIRKVCYRTAHWASDNCRHDSFKQYKILESHVCTGCGALLQDERGCNDSD